MRTINAGDVWTDDLGVGAVTTVASDAELAWAQDAIAIRRRWEDLIDRPLIEWGRNPQQLSDPDDGSIAPSAQVIHMACRLSLMWRNEDVEAPLHVALDGTGAICFEWRSGDSSRTIRVQDDAIEDLLFVDCALVEHKRMPL